MAVQAIAEGEVWAYRKAPGDPIEVTVLKVVSQSGNANVRIQFDDGPKASEVAWVSRRSLKVPWNQLDSFLQMEKRWKELREAGPAASRPTLEAAGLVVELVAGSDIAWSKSGGILRVNDLDALSGLVPDAAPTLESDSHIEMDGTLYFPWPIMLDVAQALARLRPSVLLDYVQEEQGEWLEMDRSKDGGSSWAKDMVSACDLMRSWCGEEAGSQWVELVRLRKDNARLHKLLEKSLNLLERQTDSYLTYHAKRLRGEASRAFSRP